MPKVMGLKVLITMLHECVVNEIIIYKQTPNKVYLVTANEKNQLATAKRLNEKFPKIVFETVVIDEFDVVGITKEIDRIIKKEKENKIFINVTEGRKTMVLGGVYAASLNKSVVEGAFYLRQDNHELISVPLFDFSRLSDTKRKILEEFEQGNTKVSDIAKKLKVNRSLIYASINELIKKKYITKEWAVTDSGKICLMVDWDE